MIERYYNSAIEQVWGDIGKIEHNCLLVRYSNDFSVQNLESVNCLREQSDVFFACYEFAYDEIPGGYEPYLTTIRQMFEQYETGTLEEFMDACDVYKLHQPVIASYMKDGMCKREEAVLLDEVAYEQDRMMTAIVNMLLHLAKKHPIMLVMNRFQLASRSTMMLTEKLIRQGSSEIGILFGVNDIQAIPEFMHPDWEKILEYMEDHNRVYHIGNSGYKKQAKNDGDSVSEYNTADGYRKLNNLVELLDFEQASYLLTRFDRRIKFDNFEITKENHYRLLLLLAKVSILTRDISRALEVCEDIEKLTDADPRGKFEYYHLVASAYMYLGKLEEALDFAKKALSCAKAAEDDFGMFQAELLNAQIQMSGWCNIFFCAQDIEISDYLIEKLNQYHYWNHLAHIYIYAYDNKPEIVAKAYHSEKLLIYFSKGVALAKSIGNEQMINTAY